MSAILSFLNTFWQYGKDILSWSMGNVKPLLTDTIKDVFTGVMAVASGVINTLDVGTILTQTSAAWGLLDPRIAWFMVNLGISQGLGILGVAYGIRFLLNLIPAAFTRV